jgi:hypothetical protein
MGRVVIGMDPHKHSATIEVMDDPEAVLDGARFGTDTAGYRAHAGLCPAAAGTDLGGASCPSRQQHSWIACPAGWPLPERARRS